MPKHTDEANAGLARRGQRLIIRVPNDTENPIPRREHRGQRLIRIPKPIANPIARMKCRHQRLILQGPKCFGNPMARIERRQLRLIIRGPKAINEANAEIAPRSLILVLRTSKKEANAAMAHVKASNNDWDMADAGDARTGDGKVSANHLSDRIAHGVSNSPLPPSVEAAYYQKCIDLKRRIQEIEGNNDKMRTTIDRSHRAVNKLRLERGFLVSEVVRQMAKETGSEKSDSPPPTVRDLASNSLHLSCTMIQKLTSSPDFKPQEKPTRVKRSRKQGTPPADGSAAAGNTSPLVPASPTAEQDNGQPAASSPVSRHPTNGNTDAASFASARENGTGQTERNGSAEDITMADSSPDQSGQGGGFGGGFTAVNR
jgi:hypothetical protein